MSPIRTTRKKIQVKNQKTNIRVIKRLMEISIRVDKYIYKYRPISVEEAHLYLREVTLYRERCRNDERSLQVIEKLTRNMQAIIEEQTSDVTHDSGIKNCDGSVTLSPVYSLADEDRTLLTQCITDDNIKYTVHDKHNDFIYQQLPNRNIRDSKHEKNGSVSYNISHNETQFIQTVPDLHHNNYNYMNEELADINVVNLCSEDGISEYNEQDNNKNIEITEVINDLTLNETEPCSQSILRNLTISDTLVMSAPFNNEHREVHTASLAPNLIQQLQTTEETKDNSINSMPLKSCLKIGNGLSVSESSNIDIVANSAQNKKKVNKKTNRISTEPSKRRKKSCKDKISSLEHETKAVETTRKSQATKENAKSYHNMKIFKNVNQISNQKFNKSAFEHSKPLPPKNDDQKKYVHEEMFWIENLKYVREICTDEYDPKLGGITDSFWDNCHLPDGWDDKDFDLSP